MARKKTIKGLRRKTDRVSTIIKKEIIGILIIGIACLGFVLLYTDNSSILASAVAKLLRVLAGEGSAGIFIVLAAIGIGLMGRKKNVNKLRITGVLLLWLVFEGFIHLSAAESFQSAALYELGRTGQGGGLLGTGLSVLFVSLLGITGAYIVLIVLAVIGSVLAINRSLVGTVADLFSLLASGCRAIVGQIKEFLQVVANEEKQKKEKHYKKAVLPVHQKEQAKRIPEYFLESQPEDLVFSLSEDLAEEKIAPLPDLPEDNFVTGNKEEQTDSILKKGKAPLGKLTSTPISRKTERNENYKLPPLSLVPKAMKRRTKSSKYLTDNVKLLEDTLASFGVKVKVTRVTQGPAITRYELQPAPGVKVSKITSLADDIALSLAASDVRIEAPIPGKSAVGIEVPNREIALVHFREVLESEEFQNSQSKLSLALGKDITGNPIIGDLTKMPHLLIAGATGSGKSVCINTIIASIVFKAKPDEVKLLLIDPKMVELTNYNGIPHLISPVVTDPQKAAGALKWIVTEMETRYELFASAGVRDIVRYNYIVEEKKEKEEEEAKSLPYVVVIIDELADLMMVAASEVEEAICRLAQMARAAGIHLIVATQRPSVDVITGLIKANIPSRIAFAVSSQIDSRTILDTSGAEKLLGRGDMLYHPIGINKPLRVQGCYLSDKEVKSIVDYLKGQAKPEYLEIPEMSQQIAQNDDPGDELFYKAAYVFFESNTASVSLLQRRLRIGYTRAARIMDLLEEKGVVGKYEGSKPREILMSKSQFDLKFGKVDEL